MYEILSEFKNILPGIQFNDKKYNKKLKHCWYMNRKKYKIVLIYSELEISEPKQLH